MCFVTFCIVFCLDLVRSASLGELVLLDAFSLVVN